jgi:hypothetical protein
LLKIDLPNKKEGRVRSKNAVIDKSKIEKIGNGHLTNR